MKIRNIDDYLKEKVGRSYYPTANLLSEEDVLLTKIGGERSSIEQFKSYTLEQLTSFANGSYDQVFFEMLQNASDEDSTGLWVFFSYGNGIIFINNGNPFHTNPLETNGSLYSFLGKGLADKRSKPNLSGRYGKGSKLLYNLLIPKSSENGSTREVSERLAEKILFEHQAPILYSWTDGTQLSELKRSSSIDDLYVEGDHSSKYPILCKLYLSYFPAVPGQEIALPGKKTICPFDEETFVDFKDSLSAALNTFKGDELYLKPGSLIYVPAPDSVIKELFEAFEKDNIAEEIKQTCTMLMQKTHGKLKRVFINENQYNAQEVNSLQLQARSTDRKHNFALVFNKKVNLNNDLKVNFFTDYFPISKEKHGLAYYIACKDFEILENRQNLNDVSNKELFKCISSSLTENWASSIMKDNSVYLSFISALAISEKDPRKELVKELHQKILTKAAENVPTNNPHIYEKARNVIILPDDFKELHANLFSDYYGLHPRLYGYKHELQSSFEISSYSLTQLFSVSDNGKLTVFLKQLKPIEIRRIWDKLEEENQTKYLKTIPFIPNTSGHFSSLKDFIVEENYFFCYPCDQLDFLSRQLPQHGIICNQTISTFNVLVKTSFPNLNKWLIKEWNSIIIQNKLKETSAILSKMPPLHKQKLVNNLINHDKKAFNDFIRTELSVFYNKEGKANTLSQLLSGGRFSLKTDLIDSLCIKTEERVLNDTEAYLAASSQYHHITINNINLEGFIQNNPKKQTDVLEDLLVLYNASQPKNNIIDPQLKIFYDGKKWIAPSSVFLTPGMSKLEEKDYNTIKKLIFPEVGSTLPYNKELLQLLNKPAFKNIFKITNFKDWTFEVLDLSLKQLKAFVTLVKNEEAPFFSLFKIENHNGSFKITPAKKMQYSNAEKNLNDFLKQNGYFPLPDSLNGMFSGESNLINAGSDKFISSLIDQHGALNAFCWAVKSCNIETKNKFIENLSSVDIKSNRSYNNDSEEIALIDIVLSSSNPDLLKEKLKVNGVFWTEIGVNNDIICNNHHYELSELTGQDDSISKDKLIKLLQDVDNQKKLNEVLEMKQIFVSEIKDELLQVKSLSPIQFCFLVDTATADESLKSQICEHFSSLDENPDLVNLFEEGLERKIINIGEFCDCLSDSSSNIYHKVNPTKAELWLSNEIIPENLIRWAEKSDENKDFLKSQLDKQTNVKITEEIRENLIKSNNLTVVQHSLFNQTMNWAFEGGILIKRENADILLNEIYNKKLEHEFVLVFMRWDKTEVSLKLAKMASYYLKPDSIRHVSYLVGSSIPPQEVAFSLNSILEKQKDKFPEWKELTIEETLNENKTKSTEWKEPTYTNAYKNWKNHPENNHSYTIFITNEKVPFRYRLLIDKKLQNELGSRDNGTVGRIKIETSTKNEKPRIKLYIYQSSESKESILSKIEQYQNDLFPFKSEIQDLVRLFSQINKSNTELIDTLNKNGVSNPDELKKYFESQTVHQTDNSSALISSKDENVSPANVWIDGIEEMDNKEDFLNSLDALKDLFEKYGSNALNKIMHNLMIEEEEEEDNSIPSILSGYIGEQLFKEWLKHSPGKEEVRWVADKKAAFDIEWGESARIEVKTKLKTLYDDSKTYRSTAVYLRESQFDYLEVENPGLDYYLSIISLEDLNLKKHYAGWKSKLQENADLTELTDSIKMDIQRFANEFMKEESKRTFFQQKVKFLSLDDAKKKSDFSFLIQN